MQKLTGLIGIILILVGLSQWMGGSENGGSENGGAKNGGIGEQTSSSDCKENWRSCASNDEFAEKNKKGMSHISIKCTTYAKLEVAKYKIEVANYSAAYSLWLSGDSIKTIGMMKFNDSKYGLKWCNGFGACSHVPSMCVFDLKNDRVVSVITN